MSRRARRLAWAAVFSLGLAGGAGFGQTWIPTGGSWSDSSKWTSIPSPSPGTTLVFPMLGSGSLSYTSTNDLPGPFTVNHMAFQGVAGGSIVVGAGGFASMRFDGVTPAVSVSTGGSVRFDARISSTAPLTAAPAPGGTIAFAGPLRLPSGLTISPSAGGAVGLLAENRISGVVSVTGAGINLGTVDSLGTASLVANGASLSLGSATFATSPARPPFLANHISIVGGDLKLGDHRSFTLTGNISGTGGIALAPSALTIGTWTLAGSNTFTGTITVNQAPGSVSPILNMLAFDGPAAIGNAAHVKLNGGGAAVGFLGRGTPYAVNQNLTIANGGGIGVFERGGRAEITYAGNVSGDSGLTRLGEGILTLTGNNTFTGGLTLTGGITRASADSQLGAAGGTLHLAGGALVLSSGFSPSTARPLIAGMPAGTFHNEGNLTWAGAILNNGTIPGGLIKDGPGHLTVTNNTNSVGSFTIQAGTVTASGVGGRVVATTTLTINQGGALVLDNSQAHAARISGTGSVSLRGATFRLVGNATINSNATT
ncbi:MAG: autotransporter-associated beta strand repeat-containing protein, partial [Phycisphaerales bacterium]|nr:autotransporter-associated beta strand repeat-containing protein [Phycisphaerales bacterium]